jgi:ATP adenylyltransferase
LVSMGHEAQTRSAFMGKRPLWAPWRMEYIKRPKTGQCLFCAAASGEGEEAKRVVDRGGRCFTMLNAFPYATGHVMVAPKRHSGELQDLTDEEMLEIMQLARRAIAALREVMAAEGFNVGLNLGTVAGAGIADHLHLHVVPRWNRDTNFMPVLADTIVIPQALDATRDALVGALRRL